MTKCEDCSDECKRRKKCPACELKVCIWCWHHVHQLDTLKKEAKERAGKATP